MDGGSDVVGLEDGAAESPDDSDDIDGFEDGAGDKTDGVDDGDSLGCSIMQNQKSI